MARTVRYKISDHFDRRTRVTLEHGDAHAVLKSLPDRFANLVLTSPPYNIGKVYETRTTLAEFLVQMTAICAELHRILSETGSICWQVGNFVDAGEVFPLDIYFYPIFKELGFHLRNRVVWYFDHGLHTTKRFSGRYETLLWFSKSAEYTFNLDPVRIPSKYPGKRHYKAGPKHGTPSGNPLGKNPADIWKIIANDWETGLWNIPNVKANHPEKTGHVCQFPIELVERCVLALTNVGDWVLDPFAGSGSTIVGSLKHDRRAVGIDHEKAYLDEAAYRIRLLQVGKLPYRPLGRPVHHPIGTERVATFPEEWLDLAK